ncbi:MAG TPA: ACT domain-containing protein [candidate division Zixibacteria bacterium]|jgi:ACT domain-containing protein
MPLSDEDIRRVSAAAVTQLGDRADRATVEAAIRALDRERDKTPPASDADSEAEMTDRAHTLVGNSSDTSRPSGEAHPEDSADGQDGNRIIVASFGRNRPGVAAALTAVMAECGADIADITQKILQEFFSMIMIVDLSKASVDFAALQSKLSEVESRLGITVVAQHQDVFRAMHRI